MKLVGIGDLFIPSRYIREGFASFAPLGVEIDVLDWEHSDYDALQQANLKIEKFGSDALEPPEYILERIAEADILVTHFCPVTRGVIEHCTRLRAIGVLRGGYENVNIEHATEKGIAVFNTPGRNSDCVADFTVGMMLAECRNIARGHHGLKNGVWIRDYPNTETIPDLPGRTVGIIGLGEIGQKVAKRLAGFDVEILGFDPFARPGVAEQFGVELVSLDELMSRSDFVTIHARLTEENTGMIGARELAMIKPTSYLINTARAGLVDEPALVDALREGRIAGAAIDVFEHEPPGADYPLVTLPNVTLTPHMAGGSKDAFFNTPKKLAADMIHLFSEPEKCRFALNKTSVEPKCFTTK